MTKKDRSFTIMTYNVHRLIGNDRHTSAARIAQVIETYHPDIAALQELPGARFARKTAEPPGPGPGTVACSMRGATFSYIERERNGNVVLSRYPMRLIRAGGLHPETKRRSIVPRGVLWVEIDIGGHPVQIVNTHLGLTPPERASQVKVLTRTGMAAASGLPPPHHPLRRFQPLAEFDGPQTSEEHAQRQTGEPELRAHRMDLPEPLPHCEAWTICSYPRT